MANERTSIAEKSHQLLSTRARASADRDQNLPSLSQLHQGMSNQAMQLFAESCPKSLPSPSVCPFGGACHVCPVQTKLELSQPGDVYEQEADRIAEAVTRMPDTAMTDGSSTVSKAAPVSHIQRKGSCCTECQHDEQLKKKELKEVLQTKRAQTAGAEVTPAVGTMIQNLRGGGQPLSETERHFFEPRLDYDFSKVRIHTGPVAGEAARQVNALAFTTGHDIVFAPGQYAPGSEPGKRLLAHELVHVMQQQKGWVQRQVGPGLTTSTQSTNGLFLQRQAAGPKKGPQPILLPPVIIMDDLDEQKRRQKISDAAMMRFPAVGRGFLNQWHGAVTSALANAPVPKDPNADKYWLLALAGNLTWAATSLLAPGASTAIRVMSFAGAAIGSGAAQKALSKGPIADAKSVLGDVLARMRDAMGEQLRPIIVDAALRVGTGDITDVFEQDKLLWGLMAPGIPFESRTEVLYQAALSRIMAVLAVFEAQYAAWLVETLACATEDQMTHRNFMEDAGAKLPPAKPVTTDSDYFRLCASRQPFEVRPESTEEDS